MLARSNLGFHCFHKILSTCILTHHASRIPHSHYPSDIAHFVFFISHLGLVISHQISRIVHFTAFLLHHGSEKRLIKDRTKLDQLRMESERILLAWPSNRSILSKIIRCADCIIPLIGRKRFIDPREFNLISFFCNFPRTK